MRLLGGVESIQMLSPEASWPSASLWDSQSHHCLTHLMGLPLYFPSWRGKGYTGVLTRKCEGPSVPGGALGSPEHQLPTLSVAWQECAGQPLACPASTLCPAIMQCNVCPGLSTFPGNGQIRRSSKSNRV